MDMMNIIQQDIQAFSKGKNKLWTDSYISKQLLQAHLTEAKDGATRNINFVEKSVEWIAAQFPASKFPRLLDLGCGPGIYAEKLSRKGYQVSGIDLSENSIQHAKESQRKQGLEIDYKTGDYLQLDIGVEMYDLILLIYCDFGVLSPNEGSLLVQKIFQALKSGGKLIFDVFTPAKYQDYCEEKSWSIEEDNFWSKTKTLHFQENRKYSHNTYLERHLLFDFDKMSHKDFLIWEKVYLVDELKIVLKQQGFEKIKVYSDVAGTDYSEDSETIAFVCTK